MYRSLATNSSAVKIFCTMARTAGSVNPAAPRRLRSHWMYAWAIKSQLGLEFLIVLFDRPPLMRQFDHAPQPGARREVDEEVIEVAIGFPFAEEPDLGYQTAHAPARRRRHVRCRVRPNDG